MSKPQPLIHLYVGSPAWTRSAAHQIIQTLLGGKEDPLNPILLTDDQLRGDPALLVTELTTVPMFGDRPVVWVRQTGPATLKIIESLLEETLPASSGTLVAECEALPAGSGVTQRTRGGRLSLHVEPVRGPAEVASDLAADAGIRLDPEAVAVLVELTGGDRGLLTTEVRKLADFAGDHAVPVTGDDVIAVCADASLAPVEQVIAAALLGHTETLVSDFGRARETGVTGQQVSAALVQRLFRELRARGGRGGDLSDDALASLATETFQLVRDSRSNMGFEVEAAERLLIRMAVANARGRVR